MRISIAKGLGIFIFMGTLGNSVSVEELEETIQCSLFYIHSLIQPLSICLSNLFNNDAKKSQSLFLIIAQRNEQHHCKLAICLRSGQAFKLQISNTPLHHCAPPTEASGIVRL